MKTSPLLGLSALVLALPLLAGCSAGAASGGAPNGSSGSSGSSGSAGSSGSSGSSSGTSAGSTKQCLVSAADASNYLGKPVTVAESSGTCSYTGDGIAFFSIFKPHSSAANYAADLKQLKDDAGSALVPVSGVGDKAQGILVPKDELIALDGSTEVQVTGADGQSPTGFATSEAIANALFAEALLKG